MLDVIMEWEYCEPKANLRTGKLSVVLDASIERDHCISFGGEYKCLRFLAPDVTIEWEERSKVSTGESTSELDCDITGESTRENT